jgi:hypothetical protein
MKEITFDTEGITDCPMNGKVTRWECFGCKYRKIYPKYDFLADVCIYEDVFVELAEKEYLRGI